MGDFNVNGSRLSHTLRGMKPFSGTNPDQFDDWYKKAYFTLSIARPDLFHILEGQARPSTATSGATESLEQRQAAYDRVNQDLLGFSTSIPRNRRSFGRRSTQKAIAGPVEMDRRP